VVATVDTEVFTFGPGTIFVDGIDLGPTEESAKATWEIPIWAPKFPGRGNIKGLEFTGPPVCKLAVSLAQLSATRAAWAFPGCSAVASACVGYPSTGLTTTLAADPAPAATTFDLTSVTTLLLGDFVRISPATAAEADSEVMLVTTVGTAGGTNTILQNDVGGGALIDHANGETVKTVSGTTLALDADRGVTNIKVVKVTGSALFAPGDFVRIGYAGQYETRTIVAVGTIGAAGTGITLDVALNHPHSFGAWVIKVTSLGTTLITPAIGVIPGASYHTVVLTAPGVDGVNRVLTMRNARGIVTGAMEFAAEKLLSVPLEFETTYDPADLDAVPFDLSLA
jgi:hypothetical protein